MLLIAYSAKPPCDVNPLALWPLFLVAVVQAIIVTGRIHARAAAFALAAPRMNFDCYAVPDLKLIHAGPKGGYCSHIFMTGSPVFIEWLSTLNNGRCAV